MWWFLLTTQVRERYLKWIKEDRLLTAVVVLYLGFWIFPDIANLSGLELILKRINVLLLGVGPLLNTEDPDQCIAFLSNLYAHEGGDCPELCNTGLELAVIERYDKIVYS